MQALRQGSRGTNVRRWQLFLVGQGFAPGPIDGDFGPQTVAATLSFQLTHGLAADGVAGNQTLGQAMLLGFEVVRDPDDDSRFGPGFPPPPAFEPLTGTRARQQVFGRFGYEHQPQPDNPENIRVLGSWEAENIVRVPVPQLAAVDGAPGSRQVRFHRLAAAQLAALWQAWEAAGLLDRVKTWAGSYVPRFIRGSRSILSNHAFGTAFDINVRWNALGVQPAIFGEEGSVRELVELANAHGFYWGGHFRRRPDGMHFEVAEVR